MVFNKPLYIILITGYDDDDEYISIKKGHKYFKWSQVLVETVGHF